jgi:hypothetical protein
MIAKGDYPYELYIPLPFSLVSNKPDTNELTVMPGYWFLYNLYALARNSDKYKARDQRIDRTLTFEYDYLAPDTINEIFEALRRLKEATGRAYAKAEQKKISPRLLSSTGEWLLENNTDYVNSIDITADGFENSKRKVTILKTAQAYQVYKRMIVFYAVEQLLTCFEEQNASWAALRSLLLQAKGKRTAWKNLGGQLITEQALSQLCKKIKTGALEGWDAIHQWYRDQSLLYPKQKLIHALAALWEVSGMGASHISRSRVEALVREAMATNRWIEEQLIASRTKDYQNSFRKMVYETEKEMNEVMGKLVDNPFIAQYRKKTRQFEQRATQLLQMLSHKK